MIRYGMAWSGMVWYGMVWRGVVQSVQLGVVWYGMICCGMVRYGMVWYDMYVPVCDMLCGMYTVNIRCSPSCQGIRPVQSGNLSRVLE